MKQKKGAFLFLLLLLLLVLLLCYFYLGLNKSVFSASYKYAGGDALSSVMVAENINDKVFEKRNRMSFPYSFDMSEYPADVGHYFIISILSKFLNLSLSATINLYYIFSYFLCAIVAYWVCLKFGVSPSLAMLVAIAYSFMPYHFYRSTSHLALSSYYMVPLSLFVFWESYKCKSFNKKSFFYCSLISLLIACLTAYYFFFYALILSALLLRACWIGEKKAIYWTLWILLIASLAFLLVYTLPAYLYQRTNGVNSLLIIRHPVEARIYALRLTTMLFPSKGILRHFFSELADNYFHLLGIHNEAGFGYIGILGIFGMICLFVPKRAETFFREMMRYIFVVCFFFATIDGLGLFLSYFLGGKIRALNRIVVYLAFIAFFIAAKELNDIVKKVKKPIIQTLFVSGVFAIVFLDMFDTEFFIHDKNIVIYESDNVFFQEMESNLPKAAAVYQLPYMPFPEISPINDMSDYEHAKGLLHTKELQFSYGAVKGRQADYWNRYVNSLSKEKMIAELISKGFNAIYLDTWGYQDKGVTLIKALGDILQKEPIYSRDGRRVYFCLPEAANYVREVEFPEYELSKITPLYARKMDYKHLVLGWWPDSEEDGTWTVGKDVRLRFNVGNISSDLIFRLEKTNSVLGKNGEKISVFANGKQVGTWDNLSIPILSASISQDLVALNKGKLEIKLLLNKTYTPSKLGTSVHDFRELGIRIKSFVIDPESVDSTLGENFLATIALLSSDLISFTSNENTAPYLLKGFSGQEQNHRWTDGNQAILAFDAGDSTSGDISATIDLFPFINGTTLKAQHVEILVNRTKVDDWVISSDVQKELMLPAALSNNGKFIITFNLPDAVSPKELGINEDTRKLALGFRSIRFTEVKVPLLPEDLTLSFGSAGNESDYLKAGFSGPEEGFRWTDGNKAELIFIAEDALSGDITAAVDLFPFVDGVTLKAQRVEVLVNGTKIDDWVIFSSAQKELLLPASLSNNGKFIITFNLPDAVSPKELGINEDTRKLALGFRKIKLKKAP